MNLKPGDTLSYRDSEDSIRYGNGVVMSVLPEEYSILWSRRGLTRYRRSILDDKLEHIFERVSRSESLPKERLLNLGPTNRSVAFNQNYDREKVASLCKMLKESPAKNAKAVATALSSELLTKKDVFRGTAKTHLLKLAGLCSHYSSARDLAQNISRELFFGYVLHE